jgi:hypothetical protein
VTYHVSIDPARLTSAQAWLAGGNYRKALEELDRLDPVLRKHPDVLEMRYEIGAITNDWRLCFEAASLLVDADPHRPSAWIQRSTALHRLDCTREAASMLEVAVELFPNEWLFPYHLARYACLAGDWEKTWEWLAVAFGNGNAQKIRALILNDPDLRPFWPQLEKI